jgi:hypothetical protein
VGYYAASTELGKYIMKLLIKDILTSSLLTYGMTWAFIKTSQHRL